MKNQAESSTYYIKFKKSSRYANLRNRSLDRN